MWRSILSRRNHYGSSTCLIDGKTKKRKPYYKRIQKYIGIQFARTKSDVGIVNVTCRESTLSLVAEIVPDIVKSQLELYSSNASINTDTIRYDDTCFEQGIKEDSENSTKVDLVAENQHLQTIIHAQADVIKKLRATNTISRGQHIKNIQSCVNQSNLTGNEHNTVMKGKQARNIKCKKILIRNRKLFQRNDIQKKNNKKLTKGNDKLKAQTTKSIVVHQLIATNVNLGCHEPRQLFQTRGTGSTSSCETSLSRMPSEQQQTSTLNTRQWIYQHHQMPENVAVNCEFETESMDVEDVYQYDANDNLPYKSWTDLFEAEQSEYEDIDVFSFAQYFKEFFLPDNQTDDLWQPLYYEYYDY